MSLTVQQLNADTTFLLTLHPSSIQEKQTESISGAFTILIDPWLRGTSTIFHPAFSISHHTSTPAVQSLSELDQLPDLILISQDKPDHCHKETLCSLPTDAAVDILATPAAAKKILSWQHFDANRVHVLKPYSSRDAATVVRIPLLPHSSKSAAGEITVANIPAKRDLTGLHNAIGITYQSSSTALTSPAQNGPYERGSPKGLSERQQSPKAVPTPLDQSCTSPSSPQHPHNHSQHPHVESPNVLSIIYTPHGLPAYTLDPYVNTHLAALSALPVSILFHSVHVEQNPWFLGGRVAAGAPGGVELSKTLGAKSWIGAHDEVKDSQGVATKWIKSRRFEDGEVREMLEMAGCGSTSVYRLGVGELVRLPGSQDWRRIGNEESDGGAR